MGKKILAVLAIGIVVLGAGFAKSVIEIQVSPFSAQKIMYRNTVEYNSQYGFGGKIGYSYNYNPYLYTGADVTYSNYNLYLYIGADVTYSNYKYAEKQNRYVVFGLMAKTGFILGFGGAFKTDFALKAGIDLRHWGNSSKLYPTLGLYLGAFYSLNEKIAVTAGADLNVAVQENINPVYNSVDVALVCNTGVRVSL